MGKRTFRKLTSVNADTYEDQGQRLQLEKWLEDTLESNFEQAFEGRYKLLKRQYELRESGELIGQIDILALNKQTGDLAVFELKKDESGFEVVGQLSFYMGWVKLHRGAILKEYNVNDGNRHDDVEGVVICADVDIRLFYAVEGFGDKVTLYCYSCDPIARLFFLGRWMRLNNNVTLILKEADREKMNTLGKIKSINNGTA